jgi:hypothetical protein
MCCIHFQGKLFHTEDGTNTLLRKTENFYQLRIFTPRKIQFLSNLYNTLKSSTEKLLTYRLYSLLVIFKPPFPEISMGPLLNIYLEHKAGKKKSIKNCVSESY